MKYAYSYLVKIQFLGFRFSGWQKQTNAKTLHQMVDKTLGFVFEDLIFKTIGIGRTDAKVSANLYYVQLFTNTLVDEVGFMKSINSNFSSDFKAICIQKVGVHFNIIKASKLKEYHYYFSFGTKNHPFAAPFITNVDQNLHIAVMKEGAKLFEGDHYFHKYCTKPSDKTVFKRTIASCELVENDILTANFFPETSYVVKIQGKGFLRYQIRLMVATLFELGKGNIDLEFIENSLKEDNDQKSLRNIAPASGLQLFNVELDL